MSGPAAFAAHPWAAVFPVFVTRMPEVAVGLAVLLAFASAAATSLSASLQHRAASRAPSNRCGVFAVMGYLLRQPLWLVGVPVSFAAMALHALALKHGTLTIVQPVMVTGVVMAVILRAGLERRLISARELAGVVWAAVGLGGFLLLAHHEGPSRVMSHQDAALPTVVMVTLIGVLLGYRRWRSPGPRTEAYVMATAAGLCFGTLDSLLKVCADVTSTQGVGDAVTAWPLTALALIGAFGVMLNQRAYQVAPIAVAMPVVNVVNILVAVTFAWLVYGQPPSGSPVGVAVQMVCLAVTAYGLWRIAGATGHGGDRRAESLLLEETMATVDAAAVALIGSPSAAVGSDGRGCVTATMLAS